MPCKKNLTDLDVAACTSECEPYFEMHLEVFFANGTCSIMKTEIACINNITSTCISPLLVQLHSNESMTGNITNVSARKVGFKLSKCMKVNEQNGRMP